ncbi:MAG: hypothetical protein EOO01_44590, partial [Chitinophagaceae bacterium]
MKSKTFLVSGVLIAFFAVFTLQSCKKSRSDIGKMLFQETRNRVFKKVEADAFNAVFKETLKEERGNLRNPNLITAFYEGNDYDPVFVMDHIFNGDVDITANYFEKASQHGLDPKIFKADAWSMQKVDIDLPQGVDAVKPLSDLDATTFRSGSSGSRASLASQEGSYHGAGGGNPDGKDNLLVYFEAVDDALWDQLLNKENAPLLLAGVEYEIPIYKQACDYHNIWPVALTGSREHQDLKSLYNDILADFHKKKVQKSENSAREIPLSYNQVVPQHE